jgi:hypothetical protein
MSANRDILTISLFICIPFISSSCFIALARNSRNILNRSGESGHPCHFPEFRGNGFSFSPLSMMLAIGLSYIVFIMFRYIPSIPSDIQMDKKHEKMLTIPGANQNYTKIPPNHF